MNDSTPPVCLREPCPSNLDREGREMWEQCAWIIEGGAVAPSVPLQLQALAIRRELRMESQLLTVYKQTASRIRDIASRIGPARVPADIRAELEEMANLYSRWGKP